jgi:hypothetical protein
MLPPEQCSFIAVMVIVEGGSYRPRDKILLEGHVLNFLELHRVHPVNT